jgi:phytanoyl-CoA hydroxylase
VKDRYFLESVDKIRFFYEEGAVDQQQGSGGRLLVPKERALNKVGHGWWEKFIVRPGFKKSSALHWLDPVFRRFTFHERIKASFFYNYYISTYPTY